MESNFKVVHLSTSYRGGAGRAALRLHAALLKKGIQSSFLCLDRDIPKDLVNVYSLSVPEKTFLQWQLLRIKYRTKKHLGLSLYNYKEEMTLRFLTLSSDLQCEGASLPFSNYNLRQNQMIKNADLIHLHWISGLLDYPSFFKKNILPVVWTLHDMNPFHGLFHFHEDEAGNKSIAGKLDGQIAALKADLIRKRRSELSIVTPSRWLLKEALGSTAFKYTESNYIPYTLDTNIFFRRRDCDFKTANNIPAENMVLLFVAHVTGVRRKGFDLLAGALKELKHLPFTLLVLGDSDTLFIDGMDVRKFGTINDEAALSRFYSNSDAFILPSREDNLPNVMLESLACGTPVIGFKTGGISETIVNNENGILADTTDSKSLAAAIEAFYERRLLFDAAEIRKKACEKFNQELIADKYLAVYKKMLA